MKLLKRMVSVFLSAVIVFGCLGGLTIGASAAGKIKMEIFYNDNGTATVVLGAEGWGNYLSYTTDGTAPKKDSARYIGAITISEKVTFRVAEFTKAGERVSGIKFTAKPQVAKIQYLEEKSGDSTIIRLYSDTLGAKIFYTTDGSKPTTDSTRFLEPIVVTEKTRIRAIATKSGFKNSGYFSYTVGEDNTKEEKEQEITEQPDPDEDEKTLSEIKYFTDYNSELGLAYITFFPKKSSNTIYYTTDGSKPTKSSKVFKNFIKFSAPDVLRAVEYTAKGEKVAAINIRVSPKCMPVEYYNVGTENGTKTIELRTGTPGAKIYYTLNGKTPTEKNGTLYTGPISVGDYTTIKAIAVKDYYKNSLSTSTIAWRSTVELGEFDFSNPIYAEVAAEVNRIRKESGLNELVLDEKLTEAACLRAKELSVYNSHTRPSGFSYASVFKEFGISVGMNEELTAKYYKTAEELLKYLMSGKNNITDKGYDYNSIGVGYYENGDGRCWAIILAKIK
ncbi:MAG: chitobiase/beta-hexosaminidase C-terminal domain-containing protein [Ruminiclostridium sp.]